MLCLAKHVSPLALSKEECLGQKEKEVPLKPHGLQKKKQEANATQNTSGCDCMCTKQRAAHDAGTATLRGTNVRLEHAGGKT